VFPVTTIYEKALENAIKLASWVQSFVKVLEKEKGKDAEKYGSSFRARARSFPELTESSGLLPALSFFYAKATQETYKKICQLLDDDGKMEPVEVKDEEFGYAVFLHGTLVFLQELGLITDHNHKDPVKSIGELKEVSRLALARNFLLPYVLELKKLSEALFKGEGE
jgi:CRISPR type III-B/RAMP module-associated protein Cmr5